MDNVHMRIVFRRRFGRKTDGRPVVPFLILFDFLNERLVCSRVTYYEVAENLSASVLYIYCGFSITLRFLSFLLSDLQRPFFS